MNKRLGIAVALASAILFIGLAYYGGRLMFTLVTQALWAETALAVAVTALALFLVPCYLYALSGLVRPRESFSQKLNDVPFDVWAILPAAFISGVASGLADSQARDMVFQYIWQTVAIIAMAMAIGMLYLKVREVLRATQ